MISEEKLKSAATEAARAIQDSLPAPEKCTHEFSEMFQKRMRRIFRKADHPILYRLPKQVACFVLAVFVVTSSWLIIDVKARSAFFAWVKQHYEAFIEYRFVGDVQTETKPQQYKLSWLPTGFVEANRLETDGNSVVIYQDALGDIIQFSYSQGDDAISLFVQDENTEVEVVWIGNIQGELYRSNDSDMTDALVWVSEDNSVVFCISSTLSKDTIIKMAEGVQKNFKNF